MPLVSVANLSHAHGTQRVLDDISFAIEPGQRIGLVGRNGTGKTTLLRALAGDLQADQGVVQIARGARVGYLLQDPVFESTARVLDAAREAYASLHRAHDELERVAEQMASAAAGGAELDQLMKKYDRLQQEVDRLGGFSVQHTVERTLHGLGFSTEQFELPVRALSGGQRSRLALTRLLLESPDVLLLDEPTNHLDIEGRQWLEAFLADDFSGAVLIVSHDRYLLDRVVSQMFELEPGGRLYCYPGGFAEYCVLRDQRKLVERRIYEKQMDRVRSEEQYIARYRVGQRARQASGRQARLDRFKGGMVDRPRELDVMNLRLPKAPRTGDIVINIESLSKRFGDVELFADFTFTVRRGDRIGIVGPNGSGKTTLVECLLGEQAPTSGTSRFGANVRVGYFCQTHEHLDLDLTVWQYLQSVILSLDGQVKASEQQARDLAGAFLFSGDDQDKTLRQLSGGERSRVVLAGLVSGGHNLLILDEPTNHFDIPSTERLEGALNPATGFDGTLLLITHDRALLDACVDKLLVIDGKGNQRIFLGNYRDWLQATEADAQRESSAPERSETTNKRSRAARRRSAANRVPTAKKNQTKTRENLTIGALSKLNQQKLEGRIEEIESRIQAIDAQLMDSNTHRDRHKPRQLGEERAGLVKELEPLEFEWSRRAMEDG